MLRYSCISFHGYKKKSNIKNATCKYIDVDDARQRLRFIWSCFLVSFTNNCCAPCGGSLRGGVRGSRQAYTGHG